MRERLPAELLISVSNHGCVGQLRKTMTKQPVSAAFCFSSTTGITTGGFVGWHQLHVAAHQNPVASVLACYQCSRSATLRLNPVVASKNFRRLGDSRVTRLQTLPGRRLGSCSARCMALPICIGIGLMTSAGILVMFRCCVQNSS